jgi:hypothetical protein
MYSDQSMGAVVPLGAYGHLDLRPTDSPLSKCHLVFFVSTCSQPEQFGLHEVVQHRCYTDWMDDVLATHVAVSYEESYIAPECQQVVLARTVQRPRSSWRS